MVSSAYFNEVGNDNNYQRGRDVSSSIGIVPRQHSSGGKDTLLGISKRGSSYLRCLLIQDVKAVVSRSNMFLQTVVTKSTSVSANFSLSFFPIYPLST
jgi:transposase